MFCGDPLRFSIYPDPQTSGPEKDYDHFKLSVEQALRVTEAGFYGKPLTRHHDSGYNTISDNIMIAAYLAPPIRRGFGGHGRLVLWSGPAALPRSNAKSFFL